MQNKMKCPFCKRDLISGRPRLFETLSEHVCDPNGEDGDPGERPTWECTCEYSREVGAYWNEDGEIYIDNYSTYSDRLTNYSSAIGSMARKIDITVNLGKLRYL